MPILNADTQDLGRPLAAIETQVAAVLRLHKAGKSLRWIANETSLSQCTVRTIIDRERRIDRTSNKRREKIEIDKFQRSHWNAQKRTGEALPERVNDVPNPAEWIHEIKHDRAIWKCERRSIGPQRVADESSRRGRV